MQRRAHPIQRLVCPIVGVDRDRAVGLDEDQPLRAGQMGCQPADIVDAASRNDQPHTVTLAALPSRGRRRPGECDQVHMVVVIPPRKLA